MQASSRWAVSAIAGLGMVGAMVTALAGPSLAASHASVDPAVAGAHGVVGIVVQEAPGSGDGPEQAVARLGGSVSRELPIVHGFAARLDAGRVQDLADTAGVRVISLDSRMSVQASSPSDPGFFNDEPSVYRKVVGAEPLVDSGADGHGVTVALIDTGVAPMQDMSGRLVDVFGAPCVNFTAEPTCDDTYGHGTFVAGLIAGTGAASGGTYAGTAPGANVLSVKIAGADGAADVSTVLAAIQWVVSFKDVFHIRVLNLSLGTDSTQSYTVDPLDYAVERAWRAGVAVVVAASNRGPGSGTISKPADDPFVITVGAIDDGGSVPLDDDVVPAFSSRGPTAADGLAKPDLVAPGAHLVSLRPPGATITKQFPTTMPAPYRRGSGTSFSAAVVSGGVADLLSAEPDLTPDQVKHALMSTARPDASTDPMTVGAGLVDIDAARTAPPGEADQGLTWSTGAGSLEASRGSVHVGINGKELTGGETAQQRHWDPARFQQPWTPGSWFLSQWMLGTNWSGTNWSGTNWSGTNWSGTNWSGTNWSGTNWSGTNWSGTNWSGTNWSGTNWSGTNWSGTNWSGTNWSNSGWYGTNWSGSEWYGAWDQ